MGLTPSGLAVVLFWDLLKWTCSSVAELTQMDLLSVVRLTQMDLLYVVGLTQMDLL